jgi:hypothetical protein
MRLVLSKSICEAEFGISKGELSRFGRRIEWIPATAFF